LRRIYQGKIIAVFEPNTGNRREEALPQYSYAFSAADEIIIPAFTKLKKDCSIKILEAVEIANEIKKTQPNTQYFTEDSSITTYLKQKTQPDDVVVFMGSHGFRGMIESILL
jgi:UDP-N-acetylmuramate-alanine ligase